MSLASYHQKRDFRKTTEPEGSHSPHSAGHSYLIQKHEASRLHYDFRLEVGGVLKSWAIPKGPSLNPKDKRLAVETEDHPLDYGDFEGVIPPANYGAGTVMLWDKGEWEAEDDVGKALAAGKLSFELHGERLHGRWALVKMKGGKRKGRDKEWLLIKENDEYANPELDPTEKYTSSVVSNRGMDAIAAATKNAPGKHNAKPSDRSASVSPNRAAGKAKTRKAKTSGKRSSSNKNMDIIEARLEQIQHPAGSQAVARETAFSPQLKNLDGARKALFPDDFRPQLATLYQDVPDGDEWLHEIKYDGYRLLAMKQENLRLVTRNGKDWTRRFPDISQALTGLPESIVDGELVYLSEDGVSNFEGLQTVLQVGNTGRLVFYAFDLPYLEGYDLSRVPLLERKQILADVVQSIDHAKVLFSGHFQGNGSEVIAHACQHHLEGIVSKQADSSYRNSRTRTWRKIKCGKRQEFVIVGYTPPKGSREGFGALLLGFYEEDQLRYAGKVGTGFNSEQLRDMSEKLKELRQGESPLAQDVKETQATWVKPELVGEVEFTEWTSGHRLRHPSFVGLREDKPARDVVREIAKAEPSKRVEDSRSGRGTPKPRRERGKVAGVPVSHPDKLLYAQSNITKQDLAEYYAAVAEAMLPYVEKRPLTLVRCPQGHTRNCFFQKHLGETFDESVKPVAIAEQKGSSNYAYVDSVQGLVGLVQMGTLEVHAWGSRVDDPDKPDTLIFDLDPGEGVDWQQIKFAAVDVRDLLAELGLTSFLRTSGGKGLHLVVPIVRRHTWDEVKEFCRAVAQQMVDTYPDRYVATASKAKRKNRIFIDYLRNGRGATSICNYSTRSKPQAPVATPITWQELDHLASSQVYRLDNVIQRLHKLTADPWLGYQDLRQSITQTMKKRLGMIT